MISNVKQTRHVCRLRFLLSSQWDCYIWWSDNVFIIILSELIVQCVIAIYIEPGSCTLLMVSYILVLLILLGGDIH